MKISHFITLDQGSGPVSLIELCTDDRTAMIRITHHAKLGRVREVDPEAARQMVFAQTNLGAASTRVDPEHASMLADEAIGWARTMGCRSEGLSWTENGTAMLFDKHDEALAWDAAHRDELAIAAPRKRRMIMG